MSNSGSGRGNGTDISSNPDLARNFDEFLDDARTHLMNNLQKEEKNCYSKFSEDADNYAKCMYAFQKDMRDRIMSLNYKTTFLKRKIEECMESKIYTANREEGTKHCLKSSKQIVEKLMKNL